MEAILISAKGHTMSLSVVACMTHVQITQVVVSQELPHRQTRPMAENTKASWGSLAAILTIRPGENPLGQFFRCMLRITEAEVGSWT